MPLPYFFFEAYTELYHDKGSVTGDRLRFMMDLFADKVYVPLKAVRKYFDRTWNTLIGICILMAMISRLLADRPGYSAQRSGLPGKTLPITGEIAENIYNTAYKKSFADE